MYMITNSGPLVRYIHVDEPGGVPVLTRWRELATPFATKREADRTLSLAQRAFPDANLSISGCFEYAKQLGEREEAVSLRPKRKPATAGQGSSAAANVATCPPWD